MINTKQMVIAWDLDETLVDSSHRIRFKSNGEFDLDYWRETSKDWDIISKDKLLPLSELYYEFKKTGFSQICVTARKMEDLDYRFLEEYGFEFDMILHRENSLELDEILKSKRLKEYFDESDKIPFMAYDDKQENLEIFDRFGFRTFHAKYMNAKLKYGELSKSPKDFI